MSHSLRVEGLCKRWPGFALMDVDIEVAEGEYYVLLGPTGSGKTLLLDTLMGFYRPDEGGLYYRGRDVVDLSPEARGMGYVPQSDTLFPHLSVRGNIEFGLRMRGVPERERAAKVEKTAEEVGISRLLDRRPHFLSGGENQKTQLARALVTEPGLLLLDEPLSSIDAHAQGELMSLLRRINRTRGVSVIHVTHSHLEARTLAQEMGVMMGGRLVQSGRVDEVYGGPATPEVARFLGFENLFTVSEMGSAAAWLRTMIGSIEGDVVGWRAEDTVLSTTRDSPEMAEAAVAERLDLGPYSTVLLDAGAPVRATLPSEKGKTINEGDRVFFGVKKEAVRFWGNGG
jgi:ABC-type Fe3+/spermidine/putrescine transport system ATPase subunit